MLGRKNILVIAGSDCSGGAGLQADLHIIRMLSCYGMTIVTAVTAQNTSHFMATQPVSSTLLKQQILAVAQTMKIDAIKIGMLADIHNINIILDTLKEIYNIQRPALIYDPVGYSTSGGKLYIGDCYRDMAIHMASYADIITPNLIEAEKITGTSIKDDSSMKQTAIKLCDIVGGKVNVLLKAGHAEWQKEEKCDFLWLAQEKKGLMMPQKIWKYKKSIHGTGCMLSSALACFMAKGYQTSDAVTLAVRFLKNTVNKYSGNYAT